MHITKQLALRAILISSIALTGCSSTSFTPYKGSQVIQGKGGSVRPVGQFDYWADGEPDRPYQIIGIIDDSRGTSVLVGSGDSTVAKLIAKHGGDAVILVSRERVLSGIDESGNAHYSRNKKLAVVRYVKP